MHSTGCQKPPLHDPGYIPDRNFLQKIGKSFVSAEICSNIRLNKYAVFYLQISADRNIQKTSVRNNYRFLQIFVIDFLEKISSWVIVTENNLFKGFTTESARIYAQKQSGNLDRGVAWNSSNCGRIQAGKSTAPFTVAVKLPGLTQVVISNTFCSKTFK